MDDTPKPPSLPRVVKSHDVRLDADYAEWLLDVKRRWRSAQVKAAVKVNAEQLAFNWALGRDLVARKAEERWGTGIVEQVSLDLQSEFPDAKGFSARNLWDMRQWYQFYASASCAEKLHQAGAELEALLATAGTKLRQVAAVIRPAVGEKFLRQPVAELGEGSSAMLRQAGGGMAFPVVFGFVPWGHHIAIVRKCDTVDEALFYIRRTIEENWSRSALQNAIEAGLFRTAGRAVTNFGDWLPENQSRLAQAITKDTYDLGFITLPPEYGEHELENALEHNITRFLLELGMGFAFVGRQVEIIVAGKTRRVDMLFYHIRLRCYVVLELKAKDFEPEFAGKLNFYVNAVDELLKTPDDNPTLGLLICKSRNQTEVQWAFKGINTPIGVANYANVQIQDIIHKHLPSAEQIRQRIELAEREFTGSLEENRSRK